VFIDAEGNVTDPMRAALGRVPEGKVPFNQWKESFDWHEHLNFRYLEPEEFEKYFRKP
jgi:hypothetical protein